MRVLTSSWVAVVLPGLPSEVYGHIRGRSADPERAGGITELIRTRWGPSGGAGQGRWEDLKYFKTVQC